jgi:radical SAM superfamily enzyme YgiQ (UPF0313 family)
MAKALFITLNIKDTYILPTAPGLFTALLKEAGHEVRLYDTTHYDELSGSSYIKGRESRGFYRAFDDTKLKSLEKKRKSAKDELDDLITGFAPDVIMISLVESLYGQLVTILEYMRDYKIFTVVGGVFPTFAPEILLNTKGGGIDAVCIGEGEKALVDICDAIDRGENPGHVNSLCYKENGKIIRNKLNDLVDISKNPIPDFSLFEEYRFYRPMAGKLYRMLPVETSRGCPYFCTYCNSPAQKELSKGTLEQGFFRKKTVGRIKEEISYFVKNHNPEYIYFLSDTFLVFSDEEFSEFIEFYKDIKLPFWIQTRPETVTEDKMKRLRDVGLHRMSVGIEHGNEKFRKDVLKKTVSNETFKKAIQIIHSVDVPAGTTINNMIGFPKETPELAMDTVKLNHDISKYVDSMNCNIFIPFHGTNLRRLAVESGYMDDSVIASQHLDGEPLVKMPYFPRERIKGIAKVFSLYTRFDESRWQEIKIAEADTDEGNAMFERLMNEYHSKYY